MNTSLNKIFLLAKYTSLILLYSQMFGTIQSYVVYYLYVSHIFVDLLDPQYYESTIYIYIYLIEYCAMSANVTSKKKLEVVTSDLLFSLRG